MLLCHRACTCHLHRSNPVQTPVGSPWLLELLQELQIQSTKLTRRDHLKLYHAKGTVAPVGSVVPGQVMDVLLIVILKCKCGHECDMWHVHDSTACTQDKPILQLKPEDSVGPAGGDSSILREPHRSSSRGRETTSIGQQRGFSDFLPGDTVIAVVARARSGKIGTMAILCEQDRRK